MPTNAAERLDALRFDPLRTGARSPGRILADADDLDRDGHHLEARRERREAAAVLWEHLRHANRRPSGVSRAQARRWIAGVCHHMSHAAHTHGAPVRDG